MVRRACGVERDVESVHEASVWAAEEDRGRVTMHEVPLPSWLSILMSPPNFLMIRRPTVGRVRILRPGPSSGKKWIENF